MRASGCSPAFRSSHYVLDASLCSVLMGTILAMALTWLAALSSAPSSSSSMISISSAWTSATSASVAAALLPLRPLGAFLGSTTCTCPGQVTLALRILHHLRPLHTPICNIHIEPRREAGPNVHAMPCAEGFFQLSKSRFGNTGRLTGKGILMVRLPWARPRATGSLTAR